MIKVIKKVSIKKKRIYQERIDEAIKNIMFERQFTLADIVRFKKGLEYKSSIGDEKISRNAIDSLSLFFKYFRQDDICESNVNLANPMKYDGILYDIQNEIYQRIFSGWDYSPNYKEEVEDNSFNKEKNGKASLLEMCFIATMDASITHTKKGDFLADKTDNKNMLILLTGMNEYLKNGMSESRKTRKVDDEQSSEKYMQEVEKDEYCLSFAKMRCLEILVKYISTDDWNYAYRMYSCVKSLNSSDFKEDKKRLNHEVKAYLRLLLEKIFDNDYLKLYETNYFQEKSGENITLGADGKTYKDIYYAKLNEINSHVNGNLIQWITNVNGESKIDINLCNSIINIIFRKMTELSVIQNIFNARESIGKYSGLKELSLQDKIIEYLIDLCLKDSQYITCRNIIILNSCAFLSRIHNNAIAEIKESKRKEILRGKGRGSKLNDKDNEIIENLVEEYEKIYSDISEDEYKDIDNIEKTINEISYAICLEVPEILKAYAGNNLLEENYANILIGNRGTVLENQLILKIIIEEIQGLMEINNTIVIGGLNQALYKLDREIKGIIDVMYKKDKEVLNKYIEKEEYAYKDGKDEINRKAILEMKNQLNKAYEKSSRTLNKIKIGKPLELLLKDSD